jgi:hypothetical protein
MVNRNKKKTLEGREYLFVNAFDLKSASGGSGL